GGDVSDGEDLVIGHEAAPVPRRVKGRQRIPNLTSWNESLPTQPSVTSLGTNEALIDEEASRAEVARRSRQRVDRRAGDARAAPVEFNSRVRRAFERRQI